MSKQIFDKINKYFLYLVAALTPLCFLPFTENILDSPKRFLVLGLVIISLISWLIKQKLRGEIRLRSINNLFYWAIGLILITFLISTLFSTWMGLSFWGGPYFVTDSLLSLLALVALAFLLIHSLKEGEYVNLIYLLIGSSAAVSLLALFKLYGFSLGIGVSTLVGSFNVVAIFAAIIFPLALSLLFRKNSPKLFLSISSLLLLSSVVLINFKVAWLTLILGILVSLFFSTWNNEETRVGWIITLIGCLALGIFFFLFTFTFPGFPTRPLEVSLSLGSEYDIVGGVFNEGFKSKLLGAGPATFIFKYSQYHSPSLNQTAFWGTRFKQGSSLFWDWAITKGILGVLSLIALWGVVLWKGFKKSVNTKKGYKVKLGVFSSIAALIGSSFLYSFNFSLWFLFWVMLGIAVGLLYPKVNRTKLVTQKVNIGYSLLTVLVITLGLSLIFLQGIRYYAASKHKQGLRSSRNGKIEKAINQISRAKELTSTKLNSPVDLYYRDLAQLHLSRATQVAADKENINPGLVRTSVTQGVKALDKATEIAPFNPANWNVKGFFYRKLIGIEQAGSLSLKAYKKATKVEPNSPFAYTEIGRVNLLMAQHGSKKRKQTYKDASKALNKALKLKPDYAPAHYLRAVVYDQQGNLEQAIGNLKKAKASAGQDLGLTFQLGLLYWRNDQFDKAQTTFKEVVETNNKYANAHYMLGLIYDRQNKKEKAQEEFKRVAELNPNNNRVERILTNLEQGKSALKGIATSTSPLKETPQEIKK